MNFNAILGIFLWKMTFSNPPTPLKCGKFRTFFLKPSLTQNAKIAYFKVKRVSDKQTVTLLI